MTVAQFALAFLWSLVGVVPLVLAIIYGATVTSKEERGMEPILLMGSLAFQYGFAIAAFTAGTIK